MKITEYFDKFRSSPIDRVRPTGSVALKLSALSGGNPDEQHTGKYFINHQGKLVQENGVKQ